ncbi:MAG TPA: FAD-dependent oxidoreductase, partial [Allosphingosinicella sp.]|nr:FAD-dependent oxidoreductase [Allosphingosinicella sp.]
FDLIVVGAGSAGLPAAIFAARRGASVLLLDHAGQLGGSLWVATGQMSAAGTRLQKERGIEDTPDLHFDDVMRISRGTANPGLVRLAVDNAAATFDWLEDEGFHALSDHPVTGYGHEPYRIPRYYWGEQGGLSIKDVLVPIVEDLARTGAIVVRLGHEVKKLVTDAEGAVIAVNARSPDGREMIFHGSNILLACGGYAGNPKLFERLNGYPQYNAAPYAWSQGSGLMLGKSVGGYERGAENIFVNFGTLFESDSFPARAIGRIEHFPERRMPWEIYVNTLGQRFVREDIESVDAREMALFLQPHYRYWIIFDDQILEESPPIVVGWSNAKLREAFARPSPTFLSAATPEELAGKAGIDPAGLRNTILGYNYGVETGNDFFGRKHMPRPIAASPFHAIRMQASAVSSSVGLAVDDRLRVIRRDGTAIPNLYAAGEILGSSQTMGKAACGGMMVTPAMTFGRLLGQSLIELEQDA